MGAAEIVLIVIGVVVLVLSYILPSQKNNAEIKMPQIDEGQIRILVEKEIENAKTHINDMVDETVNYSIEKTERAMERLANEKIMAVKEYSDLVLDNINKNHNEVVFLYDMLNDKHKSLVSAVSEAAKTAKEIQQAVQVTETNNKEADEISKADRIKTESVREVVTEEIEFVPIAPKKVELKQDTADENEVEQHIIEAAENENTEKTPESEGSNNNKENILRLHKSGKSDTAIAKELGLGTGEVKLVIGLYK